MAGSWQSGLTELWAHPWRVIAEASIRAGTATPTVTGATETPALLERQLGIGDASLSERWTTSAAHAAALWDVTGGDDVPIEAAWVTDLRAPADTAAPALAVERIAGGLRVSRADGPAAELILVRGDAIEPRSAGGEAGAIRIVARGRGALRIVVVAGVDAADLARARARVERRGLASLAGEREQHAQLLADFSTAIESPSADDVAAFEWAKVRADALLVEEPGHGRRLAARYRELGTPDWERAGPVAWAAGPTLGSLGAALLAAGVREPVRDALRTSGDAALAAAYYDWTGEPAPAPREAPVPTMPGPWTPLNEELYGRWGTRPSAGAALELLPDLSEDRTEMAIRRLRVGGSVVDVELRRRFDRVTAQLYRRHGAPLPVTLGLPGRAPVAVSADDEPLAATRAVVAVSDRHEVLFQF